MNETVLKYCPKCSMVAEYNIDTDGGHCRHNFCAGCGHPVKEIFVRPPYQERGCVISSEGLEFLLHDDGSLHLSFDNCGSISVILKNGNISPLVSVFQGGESIKRLIEETRQQMIDEGIDPGKIERKQYGDFEEL